MLDACGLTGASATLAAMTPPRKTGRPRYAGKLPDSNRLSVRSIAAMVAAIGDAVDDYNRGGLRAKSRKITREFLVNSVLAAFFDLPPDRRKQFFKAGANLWADMIERNPAPAAPPPTTAIVELIDGSARGDAAAALDDPAPAEGRRQDSEGTAKMNFNVESRRGRRKGAG